jgi:hypothetical protein
MPIIYAQAQADISDRERRLALFEGNIFVYSPQPSTEDLCRAVRNEIEALVGDEPTWAQQRMSELDFSQRFHALAVRLRDILPEVARQVVGEMACDLKTTYVGPPSLAAVTGQGFIAHGLGGPQHPHRATWYGASPSQVRWSMPLYSVPDVPCLAFHPDYFDVPIPNSSRDFTCEHHPGNGLNGFEWAGDLVEPRPLAPLDLSRQIGVACSAGSLILSSVAQLCSTVPNETLQTHFSIHFQTVNKADLESGAGPSNLDAAPLGSMLSEFVCGADLTPIPEPLVRRDLERRAELALRGFG